MMSATRVIIRSRSSSTTATPAWAPLSSGMVTAPRTLDVHIVAVAVCETKSNAHALPVVSPKAVSSEQHGSFSYIGMVHMSTAEDCRFFPYAVGGFDTK